MDRRIMWVAVACVALVGIAGTQLLGSRDAEAQAAAGRTLSLLRGSPIQNLKQGALVRVDLRTKVVDGSARHSVLLFGPQMMCEIHTASLADASVLYDQIRSNPTVDVNCYGDPVAPPPEGITTFLSVKLAPRPFEGHGVFLAAD